MPATNHSCSSLGISTPKAPTAAEVEDGEVDDAKAAANATSIKPAPVETTTESKSLSAPVAASEPRKSDILLKREQHLREKEARAAATSSSITGRAETSRNATPSLLPERSNNLPKRPDAPIPPHRAPHQPPRHGDRRDGRDVNSRDSRLPDPVRLDRPGERSREYAGNDRRDPGSRDFARPADREPVPPRDRVRPDPPPRWTPDSARENAERAANNRGDNSGRLSRETNMPPLRTSAASSDRGPPVNQERLPLVNMERQEFINPERAALISGEKGSSRSDSPRRARDDPRDRPSSRPQSPRRYGSERDLPDPRRDDRTSRNGHNDVHTALRRVEDSQPPAGPRSERSTDRAGDWPSSDRSRDASAFQPTQLPRPPVDPDHGRLNSSARPPLDPNFGRLNVAPAQDIPSGPRGRDSRGNRMPNAPQPRRDGRVPTEAPRATTPEKQVPTGPSSTRQPRRTASGQLDQLTNPAVSTPNTPVTAPPAPPIHPDRLKHLGPQAVQPPTPTIHPDRLKALSETAPAPPAHQPTSHSKPSMPPVTTGGPPSGPKGSQSSPISSGPNGLSAPTGPSSAVERTRGGRRQLAGINTMLQQAQNGPDRMNFRGRGAARMNSGMHPETPNSAPSTPVVPPPPPPPPGRPEPSRDLINPERADLIIGSATPGDERERDRNAGRRSGRHSRRSSRSPPASDRTPDLKRSAREEDRSRDSKRSRRELPEDERLSRSEHRDRRGGERDSERERHQGKELREPMREQARDLMAGRDIGRDRERERDRDRDSTRRDGREREGGRESHETSWAGGNERGGDRAGDRGSGGRRGDSMRGDPRVEDRRDGRGARDEATRKRRSDDDSMIDRGHEKRPRR
jgi:THO complex subunit 2